MRTIEQIKFWVKSYYELIIWIFSKNEMDIVRLHLFCEKENWITLKRQDEFSFLVAWYQVLKVFPVLLLCFSRRKDERRCLSFLPCEEGSSRPPSSVKGVKDPCRKVLDNRTCLYVLKTQLPLPLYIQCFVIRRYIQNCQHGLVLSITKKYLKIQTQIHVDQILLHVVQRCHVFCWITWVENAKDLCTGARQISSRQIRI